MQKKGLTYIIIYDHESAGYTTYKMLFNLTEAPPNQQNFQWPAANIMCTTYVQSGNSLLQQAVNSTQNILSLSFSQLDNGLFLGKPTGLSVYIAWRFNHPVHTASNIHCLNMFLDRDDFVTRSRLDYLKSISRLVSIESQSGRFERLFGKRALRKEI